MRISVLLALLAACGARQTSKPEEPTNEKPRVDGCSGGDMSIASSSQCMQDDAACYQLPDGSWCTGGRGHMYSW